MQSIVLPNQPAYAKRVIAGIEWATATAKEYKAARGKLRSDGYEVISLASSNSQTKDLINYGIVAKSEVSRKGQTIALGAWLAHAFRTGTVLAIEKVRGDREQSEHYWLCIVNDGQVVTGTDALFDDWSEVSEIAESTIDALGVEDVAFVGTEVNQLSFNVDQEETHPLAEILTKSAAQKAKLKASGSNQALLVVVAGMAVIGGGGALTYKYINESIAESEAIERAQKRKAQQVMMARQEYQELINEAANSDAAGPTVKKFWFNPIQPTMVKLKGWELESLACEQQSCSFEYINTNLTLPKILDRAIGSKCDSLAFTPDGTKATCSIEVSGVPVIPASSSSGDVEIATLQSVFLKRPEIEELRGDFMTVASLGEGTSYAINKAIEVPFSGSRHMPSAETLNQGEWGMTFPIRYIEAVSNMLSEYRGVALGSLEVNWSSRIVEIKGFYFSEKAGAK
ncbi:hypothetical protein AWH63_10375 [Marinobacter sp. C18]|uniref:type 4b pilus protein PilO2 n=1 Tax=Marinobacter sp. C18 TaxID=1772288 RepID=UPI000948F2DF|nr:type 4b pilus protein PilO2 [Marinobacter sp. C18]OLF81937.1 hypothetical protein AWH63_10375 [Marinobacter sp. C18]